MSNAEHFPASASPLTWPVGVSRTPAYDRQRARFSQKDSSRYGTKNVTVSEATHRLMAQITSFTRYGRDWVIDPDDVIISTDLKLRLDGFPRSGQIEPEDSGIAIWFWMDDEPYCYPCDKWDRIADNIVAVSKHLEAMRGMDRWGVGTIKQAFSGWKALPSPDQVSAKSWRDVLEAHGLTEWKEIKRQAAVMKSRAHPDKQGGTVNAFNTVTKAYNQAKEEFNQ